MFESLCSILIVESADREMYRIHDKSGGIAAAAAAATAAAATTGNIVKFFNFVELSGL